MTSKDVDRKNLTPMMRQYLKVKDENEGLIILFRLGDFYEAFFEDAILLSRELEITLTGRNAGLKERVPMCGVPHHSVDTYIEKLVDKGYRVGICEQLEDPKETVGIVKRDLTQIISKGTITSGEALKENEFNFIGNIYKAIDKTYICYTDITTGLIYCVESKNVLNDIISIGIKEVIVDKNYQNEITEALSNHYKVLVTPFSGKLESDYSYIYEDVDNNDIIEAIKNLLAYVTNNKMMILSHMQKVIIKENSDYLKMDIHTKRNLELTETLRMKERKYSLLWLLDQTKTAMGSRLLKTYIESPLIDIDKINRRYDMIDKLKEEFILAEDLRNLLYQVYDLERLSGRIALNSVNARDLLQLKTSLSVLPDIKNILDNLGFDTIDTMDELFKLLDSSIYENPPVGLKEGYLIKSGYSSELDELKSLRSNGKDFIAKFEAEEREKTGIKTLKVGYNRVFGYYIEVSKGMKELVKDEYGYERKQTLSNCERYISPILKEKEAIILSAEDRIIELEYNLFMSIKEEVKKYIKRLQKVSMVISRIDVLQSFEVVSTKNNYVRPTLITKNQVDIENSRHAVVEKVINDEYVANDIKMDESTDILLITGPNMAGKSTYMREFALIVIMAQIGCFVPASKAILPIFDAIYTRIGASDDLVSGKSTFMVEMNEANNAIMNATKNSLILFDELGRGTATYDGIALAQAIIEYIHNNIGCKMMFSTHYHELTKLDTKLKHLKNIHVSAYEENGKITFLHKIEDGSIDKSYGIHVARIANLPDSLIKRADEILLNYEKDNSTIPRKEDKQEIKQLSFSLDNHSKVEEELKKIDVLSLTPMDAINTLYKLKQELN